MTEKQIRKTLLAKRQELTDLLDVSADVRRRLNWTKHSKGACRAWMRCSNKRWRQKRNAAVIGKCNA